MPLAAAVIASSVIGAGTAIYSGQQQKKAAKDALNAQTAANDKSLAAQQAALDRVTQLESPFQQGGSLGMSALLDRLGLTHNGAAPGQAANDPYYGYRGMTGGSTPAAAPEYTDRAIALPEGTVTPPPKGGERPIVEPASTGPQGATPATQGQQAPDWNAYLQANPDVAEWAQNHGDPNIPLEQQTPQQRAAYQWAHEQQVYGTPPRALTYTQATPSATGQPATAQTNPDGSPTDLILAPRPQAPAAPTYARPDQGAAPTFGPAPTSDQFLSPDKFHTDPGYEFALQQGLRSANAGYAARGLLKSDAAIKGLNDYGQGMANQQYGNWFNRQSQLYNSALGQFNTDRSVGLNQFNLDRNNANNNYQDDRNYGTNLYLNQRDFANNNYTTDRAYQTGRYDTATGNLFDLARIGQSAAGAVGGANQTYADNAGSIFSSTANAQANAAQQRAQANAGMVGSVAGAATNLFNTLPGMTTPFGAPQTVGNSYGSATSANFPTSAPFVQTPTLPRIF